MAVDIQVSGDNSGAIVVGDHNTVIINNAAGAVVLRESPVRISRRAGPPGLQPRPFTNLIDRSQESEELRASLSATPPVHCNVYGAPGSGKTVLLRHVCTEAAIAAAFHDGVLYLPAASNTVDDLLQQIFDALFETDRPFKPSQVQLRTRLASAFALSVLDDFSGTAKDFERLSNLAATTTFALASESAVVGSEDRAICLGGLPTGDAVTLLSRELQRSIEAAEAMSARALCASFDGIPADILLLAARSRSGSVPLQELAAQVRSAESPRRWLQEHVLVALSGSDRKALATFAAVDGESLEPAEVAGISGDRDDSATLERLQQNGLLSFDGKRYRLRRGVSVSIAASLLALIPARAAAQYFVAVAATTSASTLIERSGAILASMRHAAQASDSQSVMTLARSVGDAVALSGRWDRWNEMLECALASARGANDAAGEAWTLHQIGSRALVLGDVATAEQALEAALHIRSQLADPDAVAVTEHNLRLLRPPADLKPLRSKPLRHAWNVRSAIVVAILAVLAAGSIAGIAATIYRAAILRPIAAVTTFPTTSPTTSPAGSAPTPRRSPVPTHSPHAPATVAVESARPTPPPVTTAVPSRGPVSPPAMVTRAPVPATVRPSARPAATPKPVQLPVIREFYYRGADASCLEYWVTGARRATVTGLRQDLALPRGCVPADRQSQPQRYTIYAFGNRPPPVSFAATIPARVSIATPAPSASPIRLGSISGVVVAPSGALRGALVAIASSTFSNSSVTGGLGNFSIRNLPPGLYRVTVSKPGYKSVTQ
ncbi:MAG TPA: carboxypeptidase regulatory-like domain-containing protein, partial [Candidatus Acidoferrum sp.]|nr:carboxypeptidase regulatory-like domain-containing protein [Candidatus Acidoferrum sp.]